MKIVRPTFVTTFWRKTVSWPKGQKNHQNLRAYEKGYINSFELFIGKNCKNGHLAKVPDQENVDFTRFSCPQTRGQKSFESGQMAKKVGRISKTLAKTGHKKKTFLAIWHFFGHEIAKFVDKISSHKRKYTPYVTVFHPSKLDK